MKEFIIIISGIITAFVFVVMNLEGLFSSREHETPLLISLMMANITGIMFIISMVWMLLPGMLVLGMANAVASGLICALSIVGFLFIWVHDNNKLPSIKMSSMVICSAMILTVSAVVSLCWMP